jgi:hypothetical protein
MAAKKAAKKALPNVEVGYIWETSHLTLKDLALTGVPEDTGVFGSIQEALDNPDVDRDEGVDVLYEVKLTRLGTIKATLTLTPIEEKE